MKANRTLAALSIIVLMAILIGFTFVRAQPAQIPTLTSDCGDRAEINPAGTNVFAFDIVQVEQDAGYGDWVSGNTYQVNWTIRIDYVNTDILCGNSYILFYLPSPLNLPSHEDPNVAEKILVNQTVLSPTHMTGTLSATFTPGNLTNYFFDLNLKFAVYRNGAIDPTPLRTDAANDAQFSPEITTSGTLPGAIVEAPEFPSLPVVAVLALASVGACLFVGFRKRDRA